MSSSPLVPLGRVLNSEQDLCNEFSFARPYHIVPPEITNVPYQTWTKQDKKLSMLSRNTVVPDMFCELSFSIILLRFDLLHNVNDRTHLYSKIMAKHE